MGRPVVRCSVQSNQTRPAKPNTTTSPSRSPIDHRTPSCIIPKPISLLSLSSFFPLPPLFPFSFSPSPSQSCTPVVPLRSRPGRPAGFSRSFPRRFLLTGSLRGSSPRFATSRSGSAPVDHAFRPGSRSVCQFNPRPCPCQALGVISRFDRAVSACRVRKASCRSPCLALRPGLGIQL